MGSNSNIQIYISGAQRLPFALVQSSYILYTILNIGNTTVRTIK